MNLIGKWKEKIAHYIEVRVQLMKLSFIERTSNILSYLVFTFISLFLILTVLIFLGIGVGEFFGEMLNSRATGFFITAGLYILMFGLLMLLRQPIIKAFSGLFIRILTENDDDEDKPEKKAGNGQDPENGKSSIS